MILVFRCGLIFNEFLLQTPTPWVVLALLPIVGGVALASVTEASFNWLVNYLLTSFFLFVLP